MYLRFFQKNRRVAFVLTAVLLSLTAFAQRKAVDTLTFTLPELEKRFLDSNFQLLASHYNVDAQKALIEQAKLWDNPVLNTDQVIAANGKFFPYGKNPDGSVSGQYYLQVQQLIKTAGKRGKQINMATTNAKISELQFQDLMRNLRYQLRTDYYNIIQQLATREIYRTQAEQLNRLLTGMGAQLSVGNVSQKDYLRIQALLISLEQDMTELERSLADNQSDLKTIVQIRDDSFIRLAGNLNAPVTTLVDADALFAAGRQNNAAYILQQTQTVYQQQNLAYQKALRSPDITLGPNFDHNSNFAPNYVGLGISLPLPILNKNQGNIKSAEFSIRQQQSLTANAETELYNNITNAYNKLLLSIRLNSVSQQDFYKKYESMYNSILDSYRQKQIGLLEFLDFFNDYTSSNQKLLQQKLSLQLAKEELNYHVGTDLVK